MPVTTPNAKIDPEELYPKTHCLVGVFITAKRHRLEDDDQQGQAHRDLRKNVMEAGSECKLQAMDVHSFHNCSSEWPGPGRHGRVSVPSTYPAWPATIECISRSRDSWFTRMKPLFPGDLLFPRLIKSVLFCAHVVFLQSGFITKAG
jgi:hypothetical protein